MKRHRFSKVAGIDVHRDTVVVTIRRHQENGEDVSETKTFEAFRDSLLEMTKWVLQEAVEVIGLESTGVYWMPVVRVLQEGAPKLLIWLINPADAKPRTGRKTDVKDSRWIAELVMYGMVNPSYLASYEQSELRKLTRLRTRLTADQTRYKNRIVKLLEASGVKLASVLSDCFGVSGRAMIKAILDGDQDTKQIAQMAQGAARRNIPAIERALEGAFTPSTAYALRQLFSLLDHVNSQLRDMDAEIEKLAVGLKEDRVLLDSIPGVDAVASVAVLAEMGADMSVFPSAGDCTAWAGLCPGSNQTGGKSRSAPARNGNKYLRTPLVQCAWSAVRTKGSIYQAQFRRLVPRLGPLKAIIAIARKMLVAAYYMLRDRCPFTPTKRLPPPPPLRDRLLKRYTKALADLGFHVVVTAPTEAVS
jgi:transposase